MRSVLLPLTLALGLATACGSDLGDRTITVALAYQGDSDSGPMDATGTATIVTKTGVVDISVQKHPLDVATQLEGWLAGGLETPLSTGIIPIDMDGSGMSTITVGDISLKNYSRVVLTIEPDPDSDPEPDPRHSIQGVIPEA